MTVTPIAPARATPQPQRPWSDETLAELVDRVRAGDDLAALSARFGRSTSGMYPRLRLLLPVDERKCPCDRVLPRLREHLADAAYDWKDVMLRTPPPAPVVRHEVKGLAGLARHHLLALTVAAHNAPLTDESLLLELRAECRERGVEHEVRQRLTEALCSGRVNASAPRVAAMVDAWWEGRVRYLCSDRPTRSPGEQAWLDDPSWR